MKSNLIDWRWFVEHFKVEEEMAKEIILVMHSLPDRCAVCDIETNNVFVHSTGDYMDLIRVCVECQPKRVGK